MDYTEPKKNKVQTSQQKRAEALKMNLLRRKKSQSISLGNNVDNNSIKNNH
ncbi:MAG: hypothetical protein K9G11_01450 [Rickettsiaceae bacterium]|nr:hypothetical protein [Rickettsiaceae bacterium]